MIADLGPFLIDPTTPIREAIAVIDGNRKGIAIVADEGRHLLGTVTDGDIRRALLANVDPELPVSELLERKANSAYAQPITAPTGTSEQELLRLMKAHTLRHVPLVDPGGKVTGLAVMEDLVPDLDLPLTAVVMAGGQGARLRPLTDDVPKPMLPVGDRPLMARTIEQLRAVGIRRVNVTTHYRGEQIKEYFGDGRQFGVEINYVAEDSPLGTAGALGLVDTPDLPILVINGDILTEVDFLAMLTYHREHQADMTVAVRHHEFRIPYGVVETDGVAVTGISEKPVVRRYINAGIYLLRPEVCGYIPTGKAFDMPDLINRLVADGRRVVSFHIREYWLDIGGIEDYQKAVADFENGSE